MGKAKEEKDHRYIHDDTPIEEHTAEERNDAEKNEADTTPQEPGAATDAETTKHDDGPSPVADKPVKKKFDLRAFIATKKGKIILASVAAAVVLMAALFAVPVTRYAILGTVIKKDVELLLLDSTNSKPVSDAEVSVAGLSARSDELGKVKLSGVPVGSQQMQVTKKYYKEATATVNVWLTKPAEPANISLEATGRQVPVKVLNKISKQPLQKATIAVLDTTAVTDEKGEAVIVLPTDQATQPGKVVVDGYNQLDVTVTLTDEQDERNQFLVVPAGKLYFLSKRTGKINVMKSDLDGSNPQVVVEGTGKEEEGATQLVASRDWRFLALKAKREDGKPKLYVIDTTKDSLTVMDEGDAHFYLLGWADHRFVYHVDRSNVNTWQPKRLALKSFDAEQSKLIVLDETNAEGSSTIDYVNENFSEPTLMGNELVYGKVWTASYHSQWRLSGKKGVVISIQANGTSQKVLKEFVDFANTPVDIKLYKPDEVYILTLVGGSYKIYEYEDGSIKDTSLTSDDYYKGYPTYLFSPSNNETLWSENRDGKNLLFVGNASGDEGNVLFESKDYRQYGWFTDDYLLLSKDGSELYIVAKNSPEHLLKITDYHKPVYSLSYGGGYGGY